MSPIPISALQHVLFCPRQYALIHLEQVWAENRFTAEGQVMHRNAHDGKPESRPGIRITRALPVSSEEWGISGVCDIVEFHGRKPRYSKIVPVEYKRGRPKSHRADEVQLCAQAVCLQEMTGISIEEGFLFYGKTRRRQMVAFDDELKSVLTSCIDRIHQIRASGLTPAPDYQLKKCSACSLFDLCQPKLNARRHSTRKWFERQLISS